MSLSREQRDALPISRSEFVALIAAIMALTALAIDSMLPALGAIAADLGVANPNHAQFVVLVFFGANGAAALVHGPLSDAFGRRPVLMVALATYILSALACAMAPEFGALLAFRALAGVAAAAGSVVCIAVVRDCFSGDAMARTLSTIYMVFMIVPVLAPSVGQAVLAFGGWRDIFLLLGVLGSLVAIWGWARLPETRPPADRTTLDLASLAASWAEVLRNRHANLYMLAGALTQGGMLGFLVSSPQVVGETFDAAAIYPYLFAGIASTMAASNFLNSRIVMRFGTRRVSHSAVIVYALLASVQLLLILGGVTSLAVFTVLLALNLSMVGMIGSNFASIAMVPFGRIAGTASSFQTFVRTVLATLIGMGIGQSFDGTALPMIAGFLGCGLAALGCVLLAERGRLFTRPGDTVRAAN